VAHLSRLLRLVLAVGVSFAWILAGLVIAGMAGVTDEPEAPTWAVVITAWLPMPMALALIVDVVLREFGTQRRDGTVPRAVLAAVTLWVLCAAVALAAR
jgi:hypothetical protein